MSEYDPKFEGEFARMAAEGGQHFADAAGSDSLVDGLESAWDHVVDVVVDVVSNLFDTIFG
jgi:hypothetical protein